MQLISVNVGRPRAVERRGRTVAGRRWVSRLNLAGEAQADLAAHGGEHRAVYGRALIGCSRPPSDVALEL